MKKNDFLELEITCTDKNGSGIAHAPCGMAVFVKGACEGDKVLAKIIKVTKNYAVAIIDKIIQPSADRISDGCPVSSRCGGCVFQHISYDAECKFKAQSINSAFERIGKLDLRLTAFHAASSTTSYRNKAVYPIGKDKDGNIISGFYSRMSHRIIPHSKCFIGDDVFCKIKDTICEYAMEKSIPVYNEQTHTGILRSIYMRKADCDGSIILTLILNSDSLVDTKIEFAFCAHILEKYPQICSIVINVNKKASNAVLGSKWRTLYGDGYLRDTLCSKKFRISPASFYQVNHAQTEVLYEIAKKYANLKPEQTLLDLYCGTGTVGICIAEKDTCLFGVEIVPQAAKDAQYNATQNSLKANFLCLDAEHALDDTALLQLSPDVITIDPPRKGCGIEAARKIAALNAKRIVYISCDPATLARDIAEFEKCGYKAISAEGVDMFPRTGHVECCVLLCHTHNL